MGWSCPRTPPPLHRRQRRCRRQRRPRPPPQQLRRRRRLQRRQHSASILAWAATPARPLSSGRPPPPLLRQGWRRGIVFCDLALLPASLLAQRGSLARETVVSAVLRSGHRMELLARHRRPRCRRRQDAAALGCRYLKQRAFADELLYGFANVLDDSALSIGVLLLQEGDDVRHRARAIA